MALSATTIQDEAELEPSGNEVLREPPDISNDLPSGIMKLVAFSIDNELPFRSIERFSLSPKSMLSASVILLMSLACPDDYHPDQEVLEFAKTYGDKFQLTNQPMAAAKDADVVITDVWASMGQEGEAETRKKAFHGYQINDEVMNAAHADTIVLHCLPAHREEEITEKVFEAHAKEIFDEAENRLHAQKAVMVKLMG